MSITQTDTTTPWGHYVPTNKKWLLRLVAQLGIARGAQKKRLVKSWIKHFGPILDIETLGIKYRLRLDDNVTDQRILTSSRRYDKSEIKALIQTCKQGTFIDLGANIGYYTLSLAKCGAQVIAVEPNPTTLNRLRFNLQINAFANNVTVIPHGVGDAGRFQLHSKGDLGSANIRSNNSRKISDSITITVKPLIEILNENNVETLSGLKIDIEGMEDRALRPFFDNAPKNLWPKCVVIEHNASDCWQENIIAFMLRNSYECLIKTRGNSVLMLKA